MSLSRGREAEPVLAKPQAGASALDPRLCPRHERCSVCRLVAHTSSWHKARRWGLPSHWWGRDSWSWLYRKRYGELGKIAAHVISSSSNLTLATGRNTHSCSTTCLVPTPHHRCQLQCVESSGLQLLIHFDADSSLCLVKSFVQKRVNCRWHAFDSRLHVGNILAMFR
jgi:hypothetical protein